jgi:hypothetical protein
MPVAPDAGGRRTLTIAPAVAVTTRTVPLLVLVIAVAGIVVFSQGLRLIDTVGMLICGVAAGASLAAIAASRRKR